MNLENIHAVRSSFDKLRKLCVAMQNPQVDCPSVKTAHGGFHGRLESTEWVLHLERLVWASWKTATLLHNGESVLVHCTDGWDRTAQVVSLAKIQLDAHYRTIEGFCELIMWEWLQMGHKFADRCGLERQGDDNEEYVCLDEFGEEESDTEGGGGIGMLGISSVATDTTAVGLAAALFPIGSPRNNNNHRNGSASPSSQASPVFLQFMDAVYQLWYMFPHQFEFTPYLLQFILESVYSCRFGTFLYNSHRLRSRKNGIVAKTASVWGAIEQMVDNERRDAQSVPADERCINPFYRPTSSGRAIKGSSHQHVSDVFYQQRIVPSFQSFRFRFWSSLYCKHLVDSTGCPMEGEVFSPLYDSPLLRQPSGTGRQDSDWLDGGSLLDESGENRRTRILFRHRVPIAHLTGDWLIVKLPLLGEPSSPTAPRDNAEFPNQAAGLPTSEQTPLYVPRSNASSCELCNAEFSLFFRRHTCRRCCRSACSNCSNHFMVMPKNTIMLFEEKDAAHAVRLCTSCYVKMQSETIKRAK